MKHILGYEDTDSCFTDEVLAQLYIEVISVDMAESFEEFEDFEDLDEDESSDNTKKTVAVAAGVGVLSGVGWALGQELTSFLKKRGIKPGPGAVKKYLPFAIAGAALAGIVGTVGTLASKKKNIKNLLANEKDPKKKEILKAQLNKLSRREIVELKKYKRAEAKAKLQAKLKLNSKDKKKLAAEIKQGVINKEKLDILKKEVAEKK